MSKQILTISGLLLGENGNDKPFEVTLRASNPITLQNKYEELFKDPIHVEKWNLENEIGNGGNSGLNAGAYLAEEIEELVENLKDETRRENDEAELYAYHKSQGHGIECHCTYCSI